MRPIQRAVLSVTDKDGIVALAKGLVARGVEILSTGGTEATLKAAGVPVRSVSDVTGLPEMLGGRVKTLHPHILGGVLARRDHAGDQRDLEQHNIGPVDLVVVNLYAFEKTVQTLAEKPEIAPRDALADAIEHIDIGGPTMIRSAAKNWAHVGVVVDPADYEALLTELDAQHNTLTDATRLRLAQKAFARTAAYDVAISQYLQSHLPASVNHPLESTPANSASTPSQPPTSQEAEILFPETLSLTFQRVQSLRYGENPHQSAAFYADPTWTEGGSLAELVQHGGKELSYNNLLDLDAAFRIVVDLPGTSAVIIKHGNPAGASSTQPTLRRAFDLALEGDTTSAFGGVIGLNQVVDLACAEAIAPHFFEVVIAPGYQADALALLTKKKNLRVLELPAMSPGSARMTDLRRVSGGLLVQTWDREPESARAGWRVVTRREPTAQEWEVLQFSWKVCSHVKSNAIVFACPGQVVGVGAGQMSRVDSVHLAARKAGERSRGAVMASDAFFPFADGVEAAAAAGISAIIQPGGSIRDEDVIKTADALGLAMVFTGFRHFRH